MGLQERFLHLLDLISQTDEVCISYWLPVNADSIIDRDDMREVESRNFLPCPINNSLIKAMVDPFPLVPVTWIIG